MAPAVPLALAVPRTPAVPRPPVLPLVAAVLASLLGGPHTTQAAAGSWERPVPGPVVRAFAYEERTPFARGQRRTMALRSRAGAPVHAACSGTVAYAGPTPAAGVVSLRCGRYRVVHAGVVARPLARQEPVAAGDVVATAAQTAVRISVRRAGDPFGYVDPAALLPALRPPAGPPPVAPRAGPPARGARHRAVKRTASLQPAPASWALWVGAALLGLAVVTEPLRRLRGHRRLARSNWDRSGYRSAQIAGRGYGRCQNSSVGEG